MAIPEHGIERDPIVFLRQVFADRRQAKPVAIEPAKHRMVVRAPGQQALGLAGDGLHHRPDAAAKLKCIAAHKAARGIRLVKFLAPQAGRRRAVAVGRLIDIAIELGVGMKHQILADQPAGIGKTIGKTARR